MKLRGLVPNAYISRIRIRTISLPILLQVDLSWEYINRSEIHECGNWERNRAVSFLGIHKSNLLCSAGSRGEPLVLIFFISKKALKTVKEAYVFTWKITPKTHATYGSHLKIC
jgi:hypothetical protein